MQTPNPTRTELAEHRHYLRAMKAALKSARAEGATRTAARLASRIRFESWALDVCSAGPRLSARARRAFAHELCQALGQSAVALAEAGA